MIPGGLPYTEGGSSPSTSSPPARHHLKLPSRDFNPYRGPATERAGAWVLGVALQVEKLGERQRKRKRKDQAAFEAVSRALLSDLALNALRAGGGVEAPFLRVFTGHRKPSRYAPSWTFGMAFLGVLKGLEELGLVEFHRGGWTPEDGKHGGAVRGTGFLMESLRGAGLEVEDFRADLAGYEPVRLKTANVRGERGRKSKGELIDYRETRDTRRWREELARANRYLEGLSLSCALGSYLLGDAGEEGCSSSSSTPPARLVAVDPLDRAVHRIWNNGTWKDGGRLYGGFWLGMPKEVRRKHLRIGGSPVAHCDFGQLFVRLAYALQGEEPPGGDLYALPGWENARGPVKTFFTASFFERGRPEALPQGARAGLPEELVKATGGDLMKALKERHPALAPLLGTNIGFKLLGVEGEVMLMTLGLAEEAGLSVLPVHDCCLCPRPEAEAVKGVMENAFRSVTGGKGCPVTVT